MLIPEDGSLPQITRKGFAAFNNVMLIKVPEKLKKPGETNFQLATLDRSKKGERWPADQYVDIIMNTSTSKGANSAENAPNCIKDDIQRNVRIQRFKAKKLRTLPKDFNNTSEKNQNLAINNSTAPSVSPNNANFNPHFIPNGFPNHPIPHRRFDDNHIQFNERTFNDPHTHRYPNNFSNDHQPYGGHDNLLGEGTSSNPPNRYGAQNQIVPREPPMGDISFNGDFNFRGNPPLYPNTFATIPQENNFIRTAISNQNFGERGRNVDDHFIQNIPDAYSTNNYNEVPRNLNYERETFPYHNSNRPEPNFIDDNNFERPPYHSNPGLNDSFDGGSNYPTPPLLPFPPHLACEGFNNPPSYNGISQNWRNRNQRFRKKGNTSWRGRGAPNNKFPRGNNRRVNNRYPRKKSS